MTGFYHGIAIFALLGMIVLAFGMSAMLGMVRELQFRVHGLSRGGVSVPFPDLLFEGKPTAVLVVDNVCLGCRERALELAQHKNCLILANDERCRTWLPAGHMPVIVSTEMQGRLGIVATPTLVTLDKTGMVKGHVIIGSKEDLERELKKFDKLNISKSNG